MSRTILNVNTFVLSDRIDLFVMNECNISISPTEGSLAWAQALRANSILLSFTTTVGFSMKSVLIVIIESELTVFCMIEIKNPVNIHTYYCLTKRANSEYLSQNQHSCYWSHYNIFFRELSPGKYFKPREQFRGVTSKIATDWNSLRPECLK